MHVKSPVFAAAVAGIITGLLSTFPIQLGPVASLPFWALVGLILGYVLKDRSQLVGTGVSYGVGLTVAFLYSRFGGTSAQLPAYTLFVLGASLAGAVAGIICTQIGILLRKGLK